MYRETTRHFFIVCDADCARKAKKSNNNRLVRDAEKADVGLLFPNWQVAINGGARSYIIFI